MNVRRAVRTWRSHHFGIVLLLLAFVAATACEADPDAVEIPEEAIDEEEVVEEAPEEEEVVDDPDVVQISFLTHWPPEQTAELSDAAEAYREETGANVAIEIREVAFGELLSTLRSQAPTPDGPTITGIFTLWLPELVRDGVAAPAPAGAATEVTEAWPEGVVAASEVDGQLYGYPNEVNLYALNYHESLFEEAGVDAPPADWNELREVGAQLAATEAAEQGFGAITNWPAGVVHPWLSLVVANGGQLLDEDNRPLLDSEETLAATELYAELVDEGITNPDLSMADATTLGPYYEHFANQETAMIVMANWWRSALQDGMGEEFEQVRTAPMPVGPSGDTPSSVSYSWMTIVNEHAEDAEQEAAWEFLAWLNGAESGDAGSSAIGDILIGMGILPSRTSDIEAHRDTLDTPFFEAYIDMLPDAQTFPIVLGGEELTNAIQSVLESVLVGDMDPQEAMEEAQERAEMILGEHYDW